MRKRLTLKLDYYDLKRIFDFVISLGLILCLSPFIIILVLIGLAIQGWPVFFYHRRLGLNCNPFIMVKFRTMKVGPSLSAKHDVSRITSWGRLLRRFSLDELPVLFNVIKGQMSLVGPRPLPEKYGPRFNDYQNRRHEVRPGITGLAQVKGRNLLSWEIKFDYDIHYVEHHNFLLDLKILFKTLLQVIIGEGVYAETQEIMPEFMGSKKSENKDSSNKID